MSVTPPQPRAENHHLYAHFHHVTDALTEDGNTVTEKTALAALYRFDRPDIDNRLLKNVTGICNVKVRCQVLSDCALGEGAFPPTSLLSKHGYNVYLTFNHLLLAPAVRLEVHFNKPGEPEDAPYLELALEFPFNDRHGRILSDFEYHPADAIGHPIIHIESTGATTEGFTIISNVQDRLSCDEMAAVELLRTLAADSDGQQLQFVLQTSELNPNDAHDFQKIIALLPGGDDELLPSIGAVEFSAFLSNGLNLEKLRQPKELMMLDTPHPMVPLECPSTFGSIRHFAADHLNYAAMSQWEGQTGLHLFSLCDHEVVLYGLKGKAVLAMKFGPIPQNALVEGGGLRLPNELEIKVNIAVPGIYEEPEEGTEQRTRRYTAVRDPYLQGLPEYDAYFVITSHKLHQFHGRHLEPSDDPLYMPVKQMAIYASDFLLSSLKAAVATLQEPEYQRFHPIALGQSFEMLTPVDIVSGFDIPAAQKDEAWNWLMTFKNWNQEQLQVIMQLKCAKGGVSLVTGTAGTGKTTVQMAMAVWFVKMGGRAACFATSNTNVATQAEAICELAEATLGSSVRVLRIVSASRGIGFKYVSLIQALAKEIDQKPGIVSTIYGLRFLRPGQLQGKLGPWIHTLEARLLEEADKQLLSCPFQYLTKDGEREGQVHDAWVEFLRYLDASLEDEFWTDAENQEEVRKYAMAFQACKGHLVALADIVITTNGNAQCQELVEHWAHAEKNYRGRGVDKIKGLGVFIDEVGKEQEIHVWNAILSGGLPRVPEFVMLLGDPKQLSPVNTSVTKDLQCNPFAARGNISMLNRLISLNWPHIHLDVQCRMHPELWRFPSSEFYGAASRDGPGTARSLEAVEPGLKAVLDGIIATSYRGQQERLQYLARATEEHTRLHYLDFGLQPVERRKESKSVAIPKHIQAFFDLVFPSLQNHFGDRTNREVMVIAAYGNAVGRYHKHIHDLQERQGLDDSWYPRILTIDSSQGQEAKMVIVDNSMQRRDRMGFTTEPGRCNVAMTRAKEVFWILGGPLSHGPLSPFPKLKTLMAIADQVHSFSI